MNNNLTTVLIIVTEIQHSMCNNPGFNGNKERGPASKNPILRSKDSVTSAPIPQESGMPEIS